MYRDDGEAADALAEQLRRDNSKLEQENAQLKAELAKRPALTPTESRRARKRAARADAKAKQRAARAREAEANKGDPNILPEGSYEITPVRDWTIRIVCGIGVAVLALMINAWAYPRFNRGLHGLWMGIFSAVICQTWNLFALSQAILGWWPTEGGRQLVKPSTRVLAFVGGIAAVVLFAVFGAAVGESGPD